MFCLSQKPRAEMSHAVLPSSAWSGYFALTPTGVVSDSTFQLNQRSFGDDPSARPNPFRSGVRHK
jgi:hypothetical protein